MWHPMTCGKQVERRIGLAPKLGTLTLWQRMARGFKAGNRTDQEDSTDIGVSHNWSPVTNLGSQPGKGKRKDGLHLELWL